MLISLSIFAPNLIIKVTMAKVEKFSETDIPYGILEQFGMTEEMVEDLPLPVMNDLLAGKLWVIGTGTLVHSFGPTNLSVCHEVHIYI